ncbi:hypothetical protein [Flavobacterium sp.]|jgi:hypothetical protein|uniref:Uncharacterized protein n=1 Tax=Flavobacterium anhuiense TaxID=459526 RepID=A0A1G5BCT9_9FLAO|nr:hypothetical protein BB050_01329 [Flavobacterium anhuiense]RYJ40121.1 hypothetical protein NU08_0877 [Flavobacterium anhuiense]SCX87906.1 hypothetical protein SAMN02927916_0639 [Flavobacterium anhuiense]
MLEKILKSKETRKLTKKEQKNILGNEYSEDINCHDTVVEKY